MSSVWNFYSTSFREEITSDAAKFQLFSVISGYPIAPANYLFIPGYSTHIIGKWHLGFFRWPYTPLYRGFDSFYGFYGGAQDYYSHKREGILGLLDNKKPVRDKSGVYSATLFAEVLTDLPDCQELKTRSEQLHTRLCKGIFTNRFIFRNILGHFFPRKWNLRHVYERIRKMRYQKGKRNVIKKQKIIIFKSVGFADCFVGLKRNSQFPAKPFSK